MNHVIVYNYLRKVKKWELRNQLLTKTQRQKILKFARDHNHLTAEDWEKYIFSDEPTKYPFHVPKPKLCKHGKGPNRMRHHM